MAAAGLVGLMEAKERGGKREAVIGSERIEMNCFWS